MQADKLPAAGGWCKRCGRYHSIPPGNTLKEAERLLENILQAESIDLFTPPPQRNRACSADFLLGEARGKMFGLLEYVNCKGEQGFLRAFSGQYNGRWLVPGWVPPVIDPAVFTKINATLEPAIKVISRELKEMAKDDPRRGRLKQHRRELSRHFNLEVRNLYRLRNFRGENAGLEEIFAGRGIPTGTGECCTPKLLHHAACNDLYPLGLCEFFIGRQTRSGSCHHGEFYLPCDTRCVPLLGFMLCGL
ncbi:hypothetical protein JWG39_00200 [Desulforhopalus vacuolatus]|uniref:hypothetical protein n=1 Tax=Desulforhopalus vacuolatus TaxID=40414 RepID=UPI001964E329|nr:hypothetical protein [Desulforhopalus vacuolatus]MBM9518234.1 hypothetical protein [Desulforhopalus vacuolatus]